MKEKAFFDCVLSKLCLFMLLCAGLSPAFAKGDVTITNPLLYSDVPDPDVICVGKDYYMISTTCHMSPGGPIMHSRDMKNWSIISYVFDTLNESPRNDLEGGNIYSRGQWAASLRYHKGTFYVFFGTGVHSYIYTTKDPAEKWTMAARFERYYHDSSMLFDTDGKVYLVHCQGGVLFVKQFTPDLQDFTDGDGNGTKIIALGDGCLHEGVHAYKINGRYYMTTIWWPRGGDRTELCFRSDNVNGPYEQRTILSDDLGFAHHGVAQGGIWQAANGEWYAMLFQDREGVGRIPCLLPCTWRDGWPMLGDENGKTPKQFTISGVKEKGKTDIVVSDDFSGEKLHLAWQWNHNPDGSLWSLTERPGYLRLRTGKVVKGLMEARNTITQRTMGPQCQGTVRMDISHMLPGDHAGLFSFCSQPGGLDVVKTETGYTLQMSDRGEIKEETGLTCDGIVWLRMDCNFTTDTALFSYSTDGKAFRTLGKPFHMIFSMDHFTGNKFAIFNYATRQAGGYVDIDSFDFIHVEGQRWTAEQAWQWYDQQKWLCGVNYIPANAINYTAMWDKTSFSPEVIDRELQLMEDLGMNCVRVVLQHAVYADDAKYFRKAFDRFLSICQKHGIKAMPIFFDDCSFGVNNDPAIGVQPEPLKGWYAWAWSPSPGYTILFDESRHDGLETYVKDIMSHFRDDPRILAWDLYNEPANTYMPERSWPLIRKVFLWAREINPSQPITSGIWNENKELDDFLTENSDIISFHVYADLATTKSWVERMKGKGRPVICTEWLNRPRQSTIFDILPMFKQERVGCMNWGLVNGKTQTHLPWGHRPEQGKWDGPWQHDLFHGDSTPYDSNETEAIRKTITSPTL